MKQAVYFVAQMHFWQKGFVVVVVVVAAVVFCFNVFARQVGR